MRSELTNQPSIRVLRRSEEIEEAAAEARRRGLPPTTDFWKHWDNVLAVDALAETTGPVVDLGCRSGQLLMWLYHLGRRELYGCDIRPPWPPAKKALQQGQLRTFAAAVRMYLANRRNMRQAPAEDTGFPSGAFSAVASMSVIEHFVDTRRFFTEAFRLLRPGGWLVFSTDYWPDGGETESGVIFSREGILGLLAEGEEAGFVTPAAPIDLDADGHVIRDYTFLFASLKKPASGEVVNPP